MKGWRPKSSICSSKPRESNFFGGISRDFAGISRKRPKSLRKKMFGFKFGPLLKGPFSDLNRVHAKGVVLCERTSFCLLSAFYKTLPSKNPSKNLVFTENPLQAPSKNPSKKPLLLENLLRTLLRSVQLHDPLRVHPTQWAGFCS